MALFIDRALRNEPLIIYGSGEQERDFLYVKDAAKALGLAVNRQKELDGKIINVATGRLISINHLADLIRDLAGSTSEIIRLPSERIEHCGLPLAITQARDILEWSAAWSLEQGITNTINWHKAVQSI